MTYKKFKETSAVFETSIWAFQQKIKVSFLTEESWLKVKKLKCEKDVIGIVFYADKTIYIKITSPFVMEDDKIYIDIFLEMKTLMHEIGHLDQNKYDLGNLKESEIVPQIYENAYSFFDQINGIKREFKEFLKQNNMDWKEVTCN